MHSGTLHALIYAGPGRDIIVDGFKCLAANRPDMNTLVGLGATASFGVSCVAAFLPKLGWKTFFEEPAMLLGGWLCLSIENEWNFSNNPVNNDV